MRIRTIVCVVCMMGWLFGCGVSPVTSDETNLQRFFDSCEVAPDPALPIEPISCSGPDSDGWSNAGRPADAGSCPAPPPGGCTKVVIGRLVDTADYIECPGYVVLNRTDWTIEMNDNFIACAATCQIGTCDPSVIVVSSREEIPDFSEDFMMTTVTSRELCQLSNSDCDVTMAENLDAGAAACSCAAGLP